jgi:NAD(P)-dependent dehydrogenase (short-subunit alcohol dehydrogenase family)
MELFGLSNRAAVVTGGSRGIGRSIALGLSEAGAKVTVAARKLDLFNEVVREIQNKGGEGEED